METEHKNKLKKRMEEDNKYWTCVVVNEDDTAKVTTGFNSDRESLDNVLHKIELDLMTNLHLNIISPIKVYIIERGFK